MYADARRFGRWPGILPVFRWMAGMSRRSTFTTRIQMNVSWQRLTDRRLRMAVGLTSVLLAAACASTPPAPTASLAAARSAITVAVVLRKTDAPTIARLSTIATQEPCNRSESCNRRSRPTKCIVPAFYGAYFSRAWKEALWDRFCTGAPQRQRRSVERYSIAGCAVSPGV